MFVDRLRRPKCHSSPLIVEVEGMGEGGKRVVRSNYTRFITSLRCTDKQVRTVYSLLTAWSGEALLLPRET